jgi:hypothetical protein
MSASQAQAAVPTAGEQPSWLSRHWLILVILIGFCCVSAPFLMSMVQLMEQITNIFKDMGDGLSKAIDLIAGALGAFLTSCQQQKGFCLWVEIIGAVPAGFWILSQLVTLAVKLTNAFKGNGDQIPVDNLADRPSNRLAALQAELKGLRESDVRREMNADILRRTQEGVKSAKESYAQATGAPFTDALKSQIAEALAYRDIANQAQQISEDSKVAQNIKDEAGALAKLAKLRQRIARDRAVDEATKGASGEDANKRSQAVDGIIGSG